MKGDDEGRGATVGFGNTCQSALHGDENRIPGLPSWSSGYDSDLLLQSAGVQSLL